MNQNNRSRSLPAGFGGVPMQVLLAAVLLLVGLGGAGWLLVNRHRSASRTEADLALQSIAELKAREIGAWMKERRGDATILASSLRLGQFLASPRDPGLRADTLAYFQALQRAYDYALVALFDAQGRLLLTTSTNVLSQYSCVASHVGMAQLRTRILDTDLHRGGPAEPIHLSFLTPIRGPGQTNGPANGVVLLLVDPQRFLFPFLRHWPTPSPSGETVLLRREGADVVYLNETRHRPGTALNLRLPAVELGLPATPTGPEEAGRFNGRDYRQIPVKAAVQAVPDTPWLVEAKLDREEIEAPIRRDTWQTALALGLAALAVVLGLGLHWRQQRLRFIEDELMERKRLEQELHEALIKYRTLFDIFPLGVTVANREGRILESNSAANAILGISTSEQQRRGIASPDWKIVRPDQTPMPVEEFASVRALRDQCVVENFEMGLVRSPAETTWISVTAAPVPLPDVALVIAYSDVSARKRAVEALQEREAIYSTIVGQAMDGIVLVDAATGRFVEFNSSAHENLGYTREEFAKLRVQDIQVDHTEEDIRQHIAQARLAGGSVLESRHRRRDGQVRDIRVSFRPLRLQSREYLAAVWSDITERKAAEVTMRSSLDRVRHLNEVLHAVRSISDLLSREPDRIRLLEGVCQSLVATRGYVNVWIGEPDPATGEVRRLTFAGANGRPLKHAPIRWDSTPLGRGPTGTALREQRTVVFNDLAHDPRFAPWRDPVISAGAGAIAAVPLSHQERRFGVLTVKADRANAFNAEEIDLLDGLGKEIARTLWSREEEARRHAAETMLERYRMLADQSGDIMLFVDYESGRLLEVNAAACRSYGYRREELLERTVFDLRKPGAVDDVRLQMERAVAEGVRFETIHRRRDGSCFPVEVTSQAGRFEGRVVLLSVVRDITEHKRMEDELRRLNQELEERVAVRTRALAESESRFRTLIRTSRDAILTSDFEGTLLDANPAAVAMFGYPDREQLLAAKLADLFPEFQPDGRPSPELVAANQHTILTQGSASFECVHRRADGTPFPAEVSVALADVEGKPVFHSITRDVSERRRAEAQLRKLGSALEQSPIAVLITDHNTRIEYVNPCFERETGYSAAEVVGCTPRLLRSGIHPPAFYAAMWQRLTAGQTWRGEICNQRKDGSRYWAASAITPLSDPAGRITHYVSIQEDITERRRVAGELQEAMEKAEAANRAKSVFLANMSHEIRTPLNAVLGFTQLLLRDPDATPRQRQRLTAIGRSGEHLLNIINDIVEMARIESGRLTLNPSIFSPAALMQDLESMFVLRAQQQELAFTVETDPGLPAYLRTDETKLRQVLINLLGNAFKFTPAHGRVALRLHLDPAGAEDRRWLRFEVEDNGPGVEPAEAARIFEPFYQTRAGQTAGGTGLGLPISRQIARHMGGDLTLTTEPGRGCHFEFTTSVEIPGHLPPASAPATAPAPVLAPECRGCPVLVVDDVAENREVLAALLTSAGFAVRVAVSGHEAIATCASALPRLVILDLRMPGLDGFEVARALRAQHGPETRILVLSASVDDQARQDSLAAGADAFMGKPFRDADLLECVRRLTGVGYHPAGTASAPAATPPGPRGPTRDALQILPADLLRALRHAVAAANHGELLALVDRAAAHDARLGAQLRDLAERYDDETLHHLLAPDSSTL